MSCVRSPNSSGTTLELTVETATINNGNSFDNLARHQRVHRIVVELRSCVGASNRYARTDLGPFSGAVFDSSVSPRLDARSCIERRPR